MIEEQFVSFETAKLLKEAGFDCICRKWYSQQDNDVLEWEADAGCNWNAYNSDISRPTQALAARWLREVHKLHVFAKRTYEYALDKFSWGYYIQSSNYEYCKKYEIGFCEYEQAIEEGLREAIKLIKK